MREMLILTRAVVVSANRPGNVAKMQALAHPTPLTWYVPADQEDDYRRAGAETYPVAGPLPNVSRARNLAIERATEDGIEYLVLLDDDLKGWRLVTWHEGTKARTERIGLEQVVLHVVDLMMDTEFHLGGVAPADNWLYVCGGPRVKYAGNVCGATVVIRLPTPVRYDPDTDSVEDLDFAMQHIREHGGLVRDDLILMGHDMRGAEGGFQSVDRSYLDLQAEAVIYCKWPAYVRGPKKGGTWMRVDWKKLHADYGIGPIGI